MKEYKRDEQFEEDLEAGRGEAERRRPSVGGSADADGSAGRNQDWVDEGPGADDGSGLEDPAEAEKADVLGPFDRIYRDPEAAREAQKRSRRRAQRFMSRLRHPGPSPEEVRRIGNYRIEVERSVTAVDLRRHTSEIIAALQRNQELLISYRNKWIGVMTPIGLIREPERLRNPRESRYFGIDRWMPRLRRDQEWMGALPKKKEEGCSAAAGLPQDPNPLGEPGLRDDWLN